MHPVRLKLLRNNFPKENCLSAINTVPFGDYQLPIGSPLMVSFEPTSAAIPGHIVNEIGELPNRVIKMDNRSGGYYYFGDKGERPKSSAVELAAAAGPHLMEVLQHSISKLTAVNFFPNRGDGWDYTSFSTSPKHFIYLPATKPLIWDEGYICELDSIYGIFGNDNPVEKIQELLSSYRYVTYCYSGFNKSKTVTIVKELKKLVRDVVSAYPHYKFYSHSEYGETYLLLDICAVSFFRLSDAITIYDSKRAKGFAMDVYAASSQLTESRSAPGANMLVRIIFNIDKENLECIDGEVLKKWGDHGKLDSCINFVSAFLDRNSIQKNNKTTAVGGL